MKKFCLIAATAFAMTVYTANAADIPTNYRFSATTPTATGKWVKISISGSGIYEITDSQLREMGFSDPSKVAVYGPGGFARNMNFHDAGGNRLCEDALQPVPLMRQDGKILFYGLGDRRIRFARHNVSSYTIYPRFTRTFPNNYSQESYYMLTDSHPAAELETAVVDVKQNADDIDPYTYLFHEKDLKNGFYNMGNIWWGEQVTVSQTQEFDYTAKYVLPDNKAYMFADMAMFAGFSGTFSMDVNGTVSKHSLNRVQSSIFSCIQVTENPFSDIENNVGSGKIVMSASGDYPEAAPCAVDYWSFSYPTNLQLMKDDENFAQQHVGFNIKSSNLWRHPLPEGLTAWDISTPAKPKVMDVEDGYLYSTYTYPCDVMVFDPSKPQKSINPVFETVPNRNLHALQQGDPIDFIIYTTPAFVKYAEELAELHREHDGINTVIVTPQELFDEFNAGTPDAMCYRMFAKMLYQSGGGRLKNVLFLGPLYADYRNLRNFPNRPEGHIGFQVEAVNLFSTFGLGMDYYGIMTDYFDTTNSNVQIDPAPITLGVGILPVDDEQDARISVDKVRRHLEKQDFSGMVNELYAIGCNGDNHTHENQAIQHINYINTQAAGKFGTSFISGILPIASVNKDKIAPTIQYSMRRGKAYSIYFGHSSAGGFTGFTTSDALAADNTELGLMFFAGCDITPVDIGMHGIGDLSVIRTPGGYIGTIGSTTTVLSNHNEYLAQYFASSLLYTGTSTNRTSTPTIGEVYARAKSMAVSTSEVAYVYVGDPALTIPVALRQVKIDDPKSGVRSGDVVTVKGRVTKPDGNLDSDYNGFVTVKLMEPTHRVVTEGDEPKMADYDYNDLPLVAVKGTVENGEFTVKVPVPAAADSWLSLEGEEVEPTKLVLFAGTYDNTTRLGGAGKTTITTALLGSEADPEAERDTQSPKVQSISYDNSLRMLDLTVTDNVAMLPGIGAGCGTSLTIDGEAVAVPHSYSSGEAVSSFSANIDVDRLAPGKHTAVITAVDLAGNALSEKQFEFTMSNPEPMRLTTLSKAAIEEMEFSLEGADNGEFNLVVYDTDGKVISETEVTGKKFSLDTIDIPAGTYTATVRRNSAEGRYVYSNRVDFSVID